MAVPLPHTPFWGYTGWGVCPTEPSCFSNFLQSSESVSLELLTYTDLETLHSRKVGAITRPPPSSSSPLNTKRYLILIYSVEFDR